MGNLENQIEIKEELTEKGQEQSKGKNSALVVAATCMFAFMGVGLVDPILKNDCCSIRCNTCPNDIIIYELHVGNGSSDVVYRFFIESNWFEKNIDGRFGHYCCICWLRWIVQ